MKHIIIDQCRFTINTDSNDGKAINQSTQRKQVFMQSACYFCPVLTRLELSRQISVNPLTYKRL
jgi:hypothetical protein